MRNKLVIGLALVASFAFGVVAFAQDATPEATPGPLTIGDVTGGNAANYYGQQVTLDGNVDELVNVRSFLLGGGGLNNPQVLVLNNSGHEFDIGLSKDAKVRVTGTIYPSYNQGGWDQVSAIARIGAMATQAAMAGSDTMNMGGADTTSMATAEPMMTETPTMTGTGNWVGLDQYPLSILTNRFPDHTILVINAIDSIEYLPNPSAGVTATPASSG